MKVKSLLLITTICLSTIPIYLQSAPSYAQPEARFYCGFTHKLEPATMVAVKGAESSQSIVVWTPQFGMTAQQRCDRVSIRFREAYKRGNLVLMTGLDTDGKGLVCAVSSARQQCQQAGTVFLFKTANTNEAQGIISRLNNFVRNQGGSTTGQVSSSSKSIDMRQFIGAISN
jgi:Circadian oscillating protein COP23